MREEKVDVVYETWLSKYGGYADSMTLRDYFASKVLLTACEDHGPDSAAEIAYIYADAMLKARK